MGEQNQPERVAITRLTIKIADKVLHISKDEAKQLKEALDEIFPSQMEPINIHWHHDPFYYPVGKYNPNWTFGNETTLGGVSSNTCTATLEIPQSTNIIT